MRLLELEVQNWGPHKQMICNLDASIVGIIGANGKGKSSLLTAISYAITGYLPMNKNMYIRELDKDDPEKSGKEYKALVRLKFEAKGSRGEIERTIWETGSARKLTWDDKTITKQAEVDSLMEDLMGADSAALRNAVFIRQGELANLVKGTPTERQEIMRKLMNLNFLAARADESKLQLRTLELRAAGADNSEMITDLQNRVKELETLLTSIVHDMRPFSNVEEKTPTYRRMRALKKRLDTWEAKRDWNEDQIQKLKLSLRKNADDVSRLNGQLEEYDRKVRELSKCDDLLLEYLEIDRRIRIDLWPKFSKEAEARAKLSEMPYSRNMVEKLMRGAEIMHEIDIAQVMYTEASGELEVKERKYEDMVKEVEEEEKAVKGMRDRVEEMKKNYSELQLDLSILKGDKEEEVCPVCGSTITKDNLLTALCLTPDNAIPYLESRLKEIQEKSKELAGKIKSRLDHKAQVEENIKHRKAAVEDLKLDCRSALEKIQNLKKELENLPADEEEKKRLDTLLSPEKVVEVRTKLAKMKSEYDEIEKDILSPEEMSALDDELKQTQANKKKLEKDIMDRWDNGNFPSRYEIEEEKKIYYAKMRDTSAKIRVIHTTEENLDKCVEEGREIESNILHTKEDITPLEDEIMNFINNEPYLLYDEEKSLEEQWENWRKTAGELESRYSDTQHRLIKEREKLEQEKEKKQKAKKIKEVAQEMQVVTKMLSRDGLPAAFTQAVFDHLTSVVQQLLTDMEAGFQVEVDPMTSCSFLFTNNNGYKMPQDALSGGQAVRLALAMLLAAQRVILPEVGLLILDEPTSHVDAAGVESMRSLFSELATLLQNAGMQLIVVDHNPALQAGFTQLIEL